MNRILAFLFLLLALASTAQKRNPQNKAVFLEDISWLAAQNLLPPDAVIVIPMGAAAKEHGPHLPLSTDFIQAEGFKNLLALGRNVIITPTVNYGFYPGFLKYAGSTSVNFSTGTEMILQIVRSLAGYGPKRFYVINVGVSTTPTLATAARILAEEGIVLFYSDYERPNFQAAHARIRVEAHGGHADELETSNILVLRPDLVDMSKAVNDSSAKNNNAGWAPVLEGGLINTSGVNGYARLATKEKGRLYLKAMVEEMGKEIDSLASCALPPVKDRTAEYKKYEGVYTGPQGRKLVISQKDNKLLYEWNGRPDVRNFYYLSRDAEDFFTTQVMDLLFVKNEQGEVKKAWCHGRGNSFWLIKSE